jgi:hypothetical protein
VAFYASEVDGVLVDRERVITHPRRTYGGW